MRTAAPPQAAKNGPTGGKRPAASAVDEGEQLQELIELLRAPLGAVAATPPPAADGSAPSTPAGSNASSSRKPPSSASAAAAAAAAASPTIISSLSESALTGGGASAVGPSGAPRKRSKNLEEARLDSFLLRHSKRYEFAGEAYSRLLGQLVEARLLNADWERTASREHRLRVLRAIRVLSRDPALQDAFLRYRPLPVLAAALARYTREYFSTEPPPAYASEIIVELCSILKRVASEGEETIDRRIFAEAAFLRSLVLLLSARDHALLQAVLVTLVNLSGSGLFVEKVVELPIIEPLLNLLNEFSSAQGAAQVPPTASPSPSAASPSPAPSPSPFSHSQPISTLARSGSASGVSATPIASPAPVPASGAGYHFLAGELLDLLSEYRECRSEIALLSGNAAFLRLLHRSLAATATAIASAGVGSPAAAAAVRDQEQVCLPVLRCIANQALEPESAREIRLLGGIQLLLGMLGEGTTTSNTTAPTTTASISNSTASSANSTARGSASPSSAIPSTPASTSTSPPTATSDALVISACICLTQLALDDENAFHMRKSGAVHALGMLFLRGTASSAAAAAASTSSPSTARDVQAHACRALRFLYSVERNRKVFKRLFPVADLFAAFIDIGHYVHALDAYERVVDLLLAQPPDAIQAMLAAFESLRTGGAGGPGAPHVVRGYVVQEVLGRGAFGTVYQVQREGGDKLYAMKELSLKEMQAVVPSSTGNGGGGSSAGTSASGFSSSTDSAVKQAASALTREVEILSQLEHPHIVRYYTSFLSGPCMYIVMELVEGGSLLDHINSCVEKGACMAEEAIWPIFIQLCLALCYMHMEKRVVHRDLTPSNIMLNERRNVRITDFGLARQTHNGTVLQSAVGTISFSCPEIVMHESYTDKADIWSLGCILYQMATGKPAFAGSNPLTVAQKIVSGSYTPLPSTYSPLFHEMVRRLLTVDPAARPDILAVSSLISPLLMAELDRVTISHERQAQQLAHEAERHRREKEEWMREKQIWRKWMANKQAALPTAMPTATTPHTPSRNRSGSGGGSFSGPAGGLGSGGGANLTSGDEDDGSMMRTTASGLGGGPNSSAALFRVSTSQLRPTSHDPLSLLLSQLHKLVFVSQLPPLSVRDLRRTAIGKFKHALFARALQPADLKRSMQLLASGSQEVVDAAFELPHLDAGAFAASVASASASGAPSPHAHAPNTPQAGSGSSSGAQQHHITHEDLQLMIEQVLEEANYYATLAERHAPQQEPQQPANKPASKRDD